VWHCCSHARRLTPSLAPAPPRSEVEDAERRAAEAAAALTARAAELDGDNRKLREAKYALDTQVGGPGGGRGG
jgi:hypothetical protein